MRKYLWVELCHRPSCSPALGRRGPPARYAALSLRRNHGCERALRRDRGRTERAGCATRAHRVPAALLPPPDLSVSLPTRAESAIGELARLRIIILERAPAP